MCCGDQLNPPRKADKTVVASIRLAGGCEGSHDLVDAGFKLGDRERFLKKRKRGSAAMEAGRNKGRRPTH
jgi:hypothetical protein